MRVDKCDRVVRTSFGELLELVNGLLAFDMLKGTQTSHHLLYCGLHACS
jgi:hypothetical protein